MEMQNNNFLELMKVVKNDKSTTQEKKLIVLPKFDPDTTGSDASSWSATVDIIFGDNPPENSDLIILLSTSLAGSASQWLSTICFVGIKWCEFKELFLQRFGGVETPAATIFNILNSHPKQSESLAVFGSRIVTTLLSCWKNIEKEQIAVSLALAHVAKIDQRLKRTLFTNQISTRNDLQKELQMFTHIKVGENKQSDNFMGPDAKRMKIAANIRCHFCGMFGHKIADCKSRDRTEKGYAHSAAASSLSTVTKEKPSVTCYKCRTVGHFASQCPKTSSSFKSVQSEKRVNLCEIEPMGELIQSVTNYDARKQLLCLVSEDNDIVLRYTNDAGEEVLKLVSWFRRTQRFIHDVSFDPTGTWLLVLCFDNTLHIVPALAVVDKRFAEPASSIFAQQFPFSYKQVTSYIIPFVGPHECPNSKKCPNHNPNDVGSADNNKTQDEQQFNEATGETATTLENFSHDVPETMLPSPTNQHEDTNFIRNSFMASSTCPYPLSVVWWQTSEGLQRAIIGYSDGSLCFVGLSPNCPFIASTAIKAGSVVKLLICKDNTFESVMLLITSSLKQQYKLLLEQKAIKYIYPGDISPSNQQPKETDWQIVLPLKPTTTATTSGVSDASNEQQLQAREEENDANLITTNKNTNFPTANKARINDSLTTTTGTTAAVVYQHKQQAPPPTYAQAISRQAELSAANKMTTQTTEVDGTTTTTADNVALKEDTISSSLTSTPATDIITSSTTPTPIPATANVVLDAANEIDDYLGRAGLLPAARARLASLKSLGSKKLNALKLRLSDQRQKLSDEQIPENTHNSFAIMDSPSLTPELLTSYEGSFYTLQNLRSTYLLSALHSQSNSLTVHSMDINLKPLFLYKIPKNCFDILISSNILYAIQYVELEEENKVNSNKETEVNNEGNTEKESRDKDEEKETVKPLNEEDEVKQVLPELNLSSSSDMSISREPSNESEDAESGTSVTLTSTQSQTSSMSNMINAVGVISSAMASLRTGDENRFNVASQLALFRFENETVLNLYQIATYRNSDANADGFTREEKMRAFEFKDIKSPMDYVEFYENVDINEDFSLQQLDIMQREFPKINYDPCYVITNKNVYFIQLKKKPFAIFLDAAFAAEWTQCREFCNTFDLSFENCIEFAGDCLLRHKKVTQALITYNIARIKPIRTALKLAIYGQTCALMHLCAMALKCTYLLKSHYFSQSIIETMLEDVTYRHAEDARKILPVKPTSYDVDKVIINEGKLCSNYVYGVDESASNLQMSPSSQFHLSNLLLITLAEKTVNDKNYMPLWNFLVTNTKYHTNMTSIVLCQSGLFSAALLLAKVRGVCVDAFMALASVVGQEFGWYSELNVCLYNLSETLFSETITYVPFIADEYFRFIQDKCSQIRLCVLERLRTQLDLFSPKMRPVVSHTYCKGLVETYLAVLLQIESRLYKGVQIKNAFSTFRINYEDNRFAIETTRFKPISAGCAHSACVVDGVAYFWGTNGVPVYYNINKSSEPPEPSYSVKSLDVLAQLNLEVHVVKCGRQHTLILTNNGLYAFGSNMLCQLGIGKDMLVSLQPMLVDTLDSMNITILEVGQYHNAAVADGQLYTWGWGVYGQLGHGNCENVAKPQVVNFFKYKKVIQVSLAHAHSLVLCQTAAGATELYVFGSNHFGQLGIGSGSTSTSNDENYESSSQIKCSAPLLLHVSAARIRLIHTKFFTNLAVDEHGKMYTWGSSPQALRLANQIKRRANARQKNEEAQKREMTKRFEATLMNTQKVSLAEETKAKSESDSETNIEMEEEEKSELQLEEAQTVIFSTAAEHQKSEEVIQVHIEDAPDTEDEEEDKDQHKNEINKIIEELSSFTMDWFDTKANDEQKATVLNKTNIEKEKEKEKKKKAVISTDVEAGEHTTPHLVDTSEVAGEILQISSGLFHFALISSSCTLYTWGKNLEHQLGTEDKERRAVNKPTAVDSIERPMYVECGADFTIVMTTDFVIKAFGGNANGQCGRELGASLDNMKGRVVCLPTTKRLMRFEGQCIEAPVEISLPRPRIRLDHEPVRYLKSIPKFREHFVQEATINLEETQYDQNSFTITQTPNDKSSSIPAESEPNSEELACSSQNEASSSYCASYNLSAAVAAAKREESSSCECTPEDQSYARLPMPENNHKQQENSEKDSQASQSTLASSSHLSDSTSAVAKQYLRNYIHYCLYVFHGLYEADKVREFAKNQLEFCIRTYMLNFKFVEAFQLCLKDCGSACKAIKVFEYFTKDTGYVPMRRQDLKFLIYYLLQHFLAFKFDITEVERFFLADLDYYLIELAYVLYFNNNNTMLEQNLNKKFQRLLNQSLGSNVSVGMRLSNDVTDGAALADQNRNEHIMQDTDVIFDCLSVKFKTIVCQRLLELSTD